MATNAATELGATAEGQDDGQDVDDPQAHANGTAETREARMRKEADESPPPGSSRTATDLTNYALQFLSNASNETLGACFVGLGATTYLVLGRVGLILIGVVGGVALHAAWDHDTAEEDNEDNKSLTARKRHEKSLDIVSRLLDLRGKDAGYRTTEEHRDVIPLDTGEHEFDGFPTETKESLNNFTDAVLRDYVRWWYAPILPRDNSFPAACRQNLTSFILKVSHKLSRKRPADMFLEFLTNSSSLSLYFSANFPPPLSTQQ